MLNFPKRRLGIQSTALMEPLPGKSSESRHFDEEEKRGKPRESDGKQKNILFLFRGEAIDCAGCKYWE
jgi:hypothetical protein